MKLVLYSGGQQRANEKIHRELVELTGKMHKVSLTYIPFCSEGSGVFFRRAVRRYQRFGVSRFQCLTVDEPQLPTSDELKRALQSDIIYLAGGNTFYFLKHLKRCRMLPLLRQYVRDGGVLGGLSAGALLITPNIALAGLPGTDPDENDVNLKQLSALNLVGFEFMPHFYPSARKLKLLRAYSKKCTHPIYACADGGGIVINGERFSIYGKASTFYQGEWVHLT